jgi:hypothetical protein
MVSCPFCNAPITLDPHFQAEGKVRCRRCGEPLPAHLLDDVPTATPPQTAPTTTWTNRKIGLSILGAMLVLAAAALTFALLTVDRRRQNDYRTKPGTAPSLTLQAPGELSALGFLPPDVNIAAAVQVAEIFKDPAGKKLLETPRPMLLDMALGTIEKWTALRAEDLDHFAVGTEIKDKLPQLTLVVETRTEYDAAALGKALHPTAPTRHRDKPLYRFALKPGEGMLWCPRPRTLVLLFRLDALKTADLEAIPLAPRSGTDAGPRPIRDILAERVNKQSLLWAAGRWDDAELVQEVLAVAALPAGDKSLLSRVKAFSLSLVSQDGLVLEGNFKAGDEAATRALYQQLEGLRFPNLKSYKVSAPPPGTTEVARWVSLQMRGEAGTISEALAQWFNMKK